MPMNPPKPNSNDSSAPDLVFSVMGEGEEPLEHPEPSLELQRQHTEMLLRIREANGYPIEREKILDTRRFEM